MKRYEYKAVSPEEMAKDHPLGQRSGLELLNVLGADGWLLVKVSSEGFRNTEEWVLAREVE